VGRWSEREGGKTLDKRVLKEIKFSKFDAVRK